MSKTFPKIIDKISMLGFPRFLFVFSRFRVFQRWEFKRTKKKLEKNRVDFFLQKKHFFSIFCFGRFSVRFLESQSNICRGPSGFL
jgi:hypothetical protein